MAEDKPAGGEVKSTTSNPDNDLDAPMTLQEHASDTTHCPDTYTTDTDVMMTSMEDSSVSENPIDSSTNIMKSMDESCGTEKPIGSLTQFVVPDQKSDPAPPCEAGENNIIGQKDKVPNDEN
jgi:hypothetical protein